MEIPFHRPSHGPAEREAAARAIGRGPLSGDGPHGAQAARRIAALAGVRHVLLTTTGTHALELALAAGGVGAGDQVICPAFTFVSAANAILRQGARPVFCDVHLDTLGPDPADVAARLTRRTRAMICAHYGGVPCAMDEIRNAARGRGIFLIEDAATALGSAIGGRPAGGLGDAAAFSFQETKNVSCGEGGALVTHDDGLAARAERLRDRGTDRASFLRGETDAPTWVDAGSNYRLSDLLAAVLVVQLDRREEMQAARERIWRAYFEALRPFNETERIRLPRLPPAARINFHSFWFLARSAADRARILARLRARGVMAEGHYFALHQTPFARERLDEHGAYPRAEEAARTIVRLPLYPSLTDAEAQHVADAAVRALSD